MKKVFLFFLLTIVGCTKNIDDFGSPDQILLLSDREIVCNGQTATLRLFSTNSRNEIPISDFVFEPLPNEIGSINPSGLLTINSINSVSEITISGTYRSKTKISSKIRARPLNETSQPSFLLYDFPFYNKDQGRPFYFWPDGSVVFGTSRNINETLKNFEVVKFSIEGDLEWRKEFGPGEAKFIKVINDKIYVAGTISQSAELIFHYVLVFDSEGNRIKELKFPASSQHRFQEFQIDHQGNFYLSTYKNGEQSEISFRKLDSNGIQVWEIVPDGIIKEIFIFPNGNIAAKKSTNVSAGTIFLTFYDQNGKPIKEGALRINSEEPMFIGPNGTLGLAFMETNQSNNTSTKFIDLFNSQGVQIATKQMVGNPESTSGTLENPTQKKFASSGLIKAFTDSSGIIHLFESSFWGEYVFLTMNSSSGEKWAWWKENKSRTVEGVLFPLQITGDENFLILFGYADGKIYRFRLGKNYSFDDCIRDTYWNKLDLF